MAKPNGQGGWDLTDEDVAEVMRASFGPDYGDDVSEEAPSRRNQVEEDRDDD